MLLDLNTDTDISLLDFPVDEPGCHYCGRSPQWRAEKICSCRTIVLICSHCKGEMQQFEAVAALRDMEMSCSKCGDVAPTCKLSELVLFHPMTS